MATACRANDSGAAEQRNPSDAMPHSTSAPARHLPLAHHLLALAVVAVWGTNFVVIRHALDVLPPLALATLRFGLAFLPAALLVKRPAVPLSQLAAYGVLVGAGVFGVMFIAMKESISPGMASLVIQTQVFFPIGLAMAIERERLRAAQLLALALAAAGLVIIAWKSDASATPRGLALTLAAALAWACANLVGRRAGRVDMLAYMVWSSAFAVPPLLALALLVEGPVLIAQGLHDAGWGTWLAVLWQSVGNTLFGYAAWAWLLARHPAATVAPWALGVPVFGMASSAALLGEALPAWKVAAAGLVIAGLALNVLGLRLHSPR